MIGRLLSGLALALIRLYQIAVSPALHLLAGPGHGCRFEPSCSEYAGKSVSKHGVWRGGALALKRFGRCHPWGGPGEVEEVN